MNETQAYFCAQFCLEFTWEHYTFTAKTADEPSISPNRHKINQTPACHTYKAKVSTLQSKLISKLMDFPVGTALTPI